MGKHGLTFIKTWKAHGINCGIAVGPFGGLNGYVQVSHKLKEFYRIEENIYALNVHGGITYSMDKDRWIGFDTNHLGDTWDMEERRKYIKHLPKKMQKEFEPTVRVAPSLFTGTRLWTMEKIMAETESLAKQIKE